MVIAIVVLAAGFVIAAVACVLLKQDIRSISRSLKAIRKSDTNAKVTTQTFDKDIIHLSNRINEVLEDQKKAVLSAEKMNQELKQAITNVSHDLKTPLASAMGYLQLIRSNKTPEEKKPEYLDIIEKRLKSLSYLLDELFEFTKITEGKIEFKPEKINVSNILSDVLSLYYEDFTAKGSTPNITLPENPVYIFADVNMLRHIFQNLIQNVLAHGTGSFSVTVQPEARVLFKNSVEHPEKIDAGRLFERFYTADISRNSKTTGLGLAICKELVERQDGKIRAFIEDDSLIITIKFKQNKDK